MPKRRGSSGLDALIAIDKPCGMTSHDVVYRVRRALNESRVGHAGTLDPDASGVLVVGVGQGTRLMGHLTADHKSYIGLVVLGTETDTEDSAGEVIRSCEPPSWAFDDARVREVVHSLVGDHMQVPPAYSAISVDGVRSYARARAGESVELPPRPITIESAELLAIQDVDGAPGWLCSFSVSKGCYIRSIARDLGRSVGSAAHLKDLRRTSSGTVGLGSCITLEQLAELGKDAVLTRALDPVVSLGLPVKRVSSAERDDVLVGKHIPIGTFSDAYAPDENDFVSIVSADRLLGIWQRRGRCLVCSTNFPNGVMGVAHE